MALLAQGLKRAGGPRVYRGPPKRRREPPTVAQGQEWESKTAPAVVRCDVDLDCLGVGAPRLLMKERRKRLLRMLVGNAINGPACAGWPGHDSSSPFQRAGSARSVGRLATEPTPPPFGCAGRPLRRRYTSEPSR
jgi:hypothetical protein